MSLSKWVLAAGLILGAAGAQAAPLPYVAVDAPPSAQKVQFYFGWDDPPPPRTYYYDPPPPRYYRPPPPRYYGPPPRRAYNPPAPPEAYGFYDKETTKAYRRAQKDVYKERVRAWNRANGY